MLPNIWPWVRHLDFLSHCFREAAPLHWQLWDLGGNNGCRLDCSFFLSYSTGYQGADMAASRGSISPGLQRHQRTGRFCPFHPGTSQWGETIKLAFANKQEVVRFRDCQMSWRGQMQLWQPRHSGCLLSQRLYRDGWTPGPWRQQDIG